MTVTAPECSRVSPRDVPASLALRSQTDPVGWFVHDLAMVNEGSGAIFGISEKIGVGMTMSRRVTDPPMQILITLAGGIPIFAYGEYMIANEKHTCIQINIS